MKSAPAACCLALLLLSSAASADSYDDFLFAVRFNDSAKLQTLLARGMDANAVEALRGETALMIALREKSFKVRDLLLQLPELKLEARATNGDTALMLAAFLGDSDSVAKLIAAGAEVNQVGWTALHYAAASGNPETIAVLLEHAAYIDTESPNKTTPLMMAVRSGKNAAVELLIDEGADLYLKNDRGMTALDFALENERKDLILLLKNRLAAKPN
ncbi:MULTISPECIES: ankyrin repeat domain-containing protein [unclassified Undibacterium]|uniref:ankyrin repeat domain-containing protein n=1 Tax=unclassified Undibacterium TaxID=2630295 RepID=UPI002AC9966E|nr:MULTISPECIES: ankyrin repeat domain-containing protein [unclassified Undibacterium]MEB0138533.1 ankyrin repeat domain-containing protein [Undibacterium sp. CCC2.1]MEB0171403.1 ankyrin repeat domain-containing protein [Undibacterium sp. CCC1.1]MEB0175297.1 ankyrin repeat domain-containing protein [Undibacterium sp. CCC3.4]MEB0214599.1 ankyrin repeat domain-containing protein [Undibacterium sp. 5I2]WPX43028.1 ankyrin repeat domain-containing protein [Undibacterium sp. CCC3.4]